MYVCIYIYIYICYYYTFYDIIYIVGTKRAQTDDRDQERADRERQRVDVAQLEIMRTAPWSGLLNSRIR